MDREQELNRTNTIVKDILQKCEPARNSDNILYIKVVERLNRNALDRPFWEVMANLEDLGLPCYETVRRTRQKVQAEHQELKGCDKVQTYRKINEEIYEEYARS